MVDINIQWKVVLFRQYKIISNMILYFSFNLYDIAWKAVKMIILALLLFVIPKGFELNFLWPLTNLLDSQNVIALVEILVNKNWWHHLKYCFFMKIAFNSFKIIRVLICFEKNLYLHYTFALLMQRSIVSYLYLIHLFKSNNIIL